MYDAKREKLIDDGRMRILRRDLKNEDARWCVFKHNVRLSVALFILGVAALFAI